MDFVDFVQLLASPSRMSSLIPLVVYVVMVVPVFSFFRRFKAFRDSPNFQDMDSFVYGEDGSLVLGPPVASSTPIKCRDAVDSNNGGCDICWDSDSAAVVSSTVQAVVDSQSDGTYSFDNTPVDGSILEYLRPRTPKPKIDELRRVPLQL